MSQFTKALVVTPLRKAEPRRGGLGTPEDHNGAGIRRLSFFRHIHIHDPVSFCLKTAKALKQVVSLPKVLPAVNGFILL